MIRRGHTLPLLIAMTIMCSPLGRPSVRAIARLAGTLPQTREFILDVK
jgi:hypothetical protein